MPTLHTGAATLQLTLSARHAAGPPVEAEAPADTAPAQYDADMLERLEAFRMVFAPLFAQLDTTRTSNTKPVFYKSEFGCLDEHQLAQIVFDYLSPAKAFGVFDAAFSAYYRSVQAGTRADILVPWDDTPPAQYDPPPLRYVGRFPLRVATAEESAIAQGQAPA